MMHSGNPALWSCLWTADGQGHPSEPRGDLRQALHHLDTAPSCTGKATPPLDLEAGFIWSTRPLQCRGSNSGWGPEGISYCRSVIRGCWGKTSREPLGVFWWWV